MKLYIANDLGCVYRLKNGQLEYAPQMQDSTFDTSEFNLVEPDLVGEEDIKSMGDKVHNRETVKKLVPCDNEALAMYRD